MQGIERIPTELRRLYKTAFQIAPTWILQCTDARQKWIDQAQSTNLWLADPATRTASFMYREAWERGLKTTYYLRTVNKSCIDNAHRERRVPELAKTEVTDSEKMACSSKRCETAGHATLVSRFS